MSRDNALRGLWRSFQGSYLQRFGTKRRSANGTGVDDHDNNRDTHSYREEIIIFILMPQGCYETNGHHIGIFCVNKDYRNCGVKSCSYL